MKKQQPRVESHNDEHDLTVGGVYSFTDSRGRTERGRLLYLFTRRVYRTEVGGDLDPSSWKVIQFRTGYVPENPAPGVCSVHLELGLFKINA